MRSGIQIEGASVVRPVASGYRSVHRLLNHLQQAGFVGSPQVLAVEGHCERLTFLAGDTYEDAGSGPIATERALVSAAQLLRKLHDCSASFLPRQAIDDQQWLLPAQQPAEVICHGDYAPYNVVLKGDQVVGVFDFDAAHPGPRLWDLAYAVYCWAPLKSLPNLSVAEIDKSVERACSFLDAYGLSFDRRAFLVDMMIQRLQALVAFMREQATDGDEKFNADINAGHLDRYLADIDYLQCHDLWLTDLLMNRANPSTGPR
ncbi:phosphotransferase [Saccharospirillum sp. HFRX-1]|uniref:phosphotransferase enzyme family protein n=1 Tax=unclassified Saccharospirillum TaxID=2633430 RepID=UPI0037177F5D